AACARAPARARTSAGTRSSRTSARAARRARGAAMDDADGEVQVADIDDADLAIDAWRRVHLLHFFIGDVGGRRRLLRRHDRRQRARRGKNIESCPSHELLLESRYYTACAPKCDRYQRPQWPRL